MGSLPLSPGRRCRRLGALVGWFGRVALRVAQQEDAATDGVSLQLRECHRSRLWLRIVDKRTPPLVEHPN